MYHRSIATFPPMAEGAGELAVSCPVGAGVKALVVYNFGAF